MIFLLSTTLSHNVIKEKLTELIEQRFNREESLYLALNIVCGHARELVTPSIVFWITYI